MIADATAIPRLGRSDTIYLIGKGQPDASLMRRAGAVQTPKGWTIPRARSVDLAMIEDHLPRYARRTVIPMMVDLIPETSWCASLANMLLDSSWKVLREVTAFQVGGCEECGARDRLECHELWSYDEVTCVQKLVRLETLCGPCHETRHLGFASARGRYRDVLSRLGRINRLRDDELRVYGDLVFDAFGRRSKIDWTLDLSILQGCEMRLKKCFEIVGPGIVAGRVGKREVEAVIKGIGLESSKRGVMLC